MLSRQLNLMKRIDRRHFSAIIVGMLVFILICALDRGWYSIWLSWAKPQSLFPWPDKYIALLMVVDLLCISIIPGFASGWYAARITSDHKLLIGTIPSVLCSFMLFGGFLPSSVITDFSLFILGSLGGLAGAILKCRLN